LKRYAKGKGIRIISDIPIFVPYDSADAWSHPELFRFDEDGNPTLVAGVPPDFFSPTGQLGGNPLYRWDVMARVGYAWWIERFRAALQQVDIIRLDHFRGFETHWALPAGEQTAAKGCWGKGPGADLFHALEQALGRQPSSPGSSSPSSCLIACAGGAPGRAVTTEPNRGDLAGAP
jgi:4-alpha-glucanotransferase